MPTAQRSSPTATPPGMQVTPTPVRQSCPCAVAMYADQSLNMQRVLLDYYVIECRKLAAARPCPASWQGPPGRALSPHNLLVWAHARTCLSDGSSHCACAAAAGASAPTRASWRRPAPSARRCRSGCCARCATWGRACPATSALPPACTPTSTCSPSASPLWRRAMVSRYSKV